MGEWSPFTLNEFEWEILKVYLKHGYGVATDTLKNKLLVDIICTFESEVEK